VPVVSSKTFIIIEREFRTANCKARHTDRKHVLTRLRNLRKFEVSTTLHTRPTCGSDLSKLPLDFHFHLSVDHGCTSKVMERKSIVEVSPMVNALLSKLMSPPDVSATVP